MTSALDQTCAKSFSTSAASATISRVRRIRPVSLRRELASVGDWFAQGPVIGPKVRVMLGYSV